MTSAHATNPKHQSRLAAFGWTAYDVENVVRQLPAGLPSVALVLASSPHKVRVGGATGRHLVGIVRDDVLVTVVIADKLCPRKLRVEHVVH
jgi:hypothetical protein